MIVYLIMILIISNGNGSGGKVSSTIQIEFNTRTNIHSQSDCETVKGKLETFYKTQVVSSHCVTNKVGD